MAKKTSGLVLVSLGPVRKLPPVISKKRQQRTQRKERQKANVKKERGPIHGKRGGIERNWGTKDRATRGAAEKKIRVGQRGKFPCQKTLDERETSRSDTSRKKGHAPRVWGSSSGRHGGIKSTQKEN